MYLEYYGLSQEPFHITPDPYFFYLSPSHKESFASLIYGLQNRKGFIALTGEVGLGKTTVLRAFLNKLSTETKIKTVFVFNPDLSFKGLLLTMYSELGLELPASCKTAPGSESSLSIQDQVFELVQGLHQALIREYENNCSVILVIDEAQNMPLPTLENLRMLSNLETSRDKLLQIFLIGQTELDRILDKLELRQLRQRIAIRTVLQPLSSRESKDYILHRLKLAGAVKELFTPAALRLITRYSRGVPRKINILCNNALVTGYGYGSKVITPKIVREAINDLEGRQAGQKRLKYALAAGLALAVIGAGLWLGPYKSGEKLIPWNKNVDMSSQEITPLESAAADAHLPAAAGDEAPPVLDSSGAQEEIGPDPSPGLQPLDLEPERPEQAQIPAPQATHLHPDRDQFPLPQEEMTPATTFIHDKLKEVVPVYKSLSPTRQAVLIRMADQTSINGLLSFRLMLSALEREDYQEASQEMLNSNWADSVGGIAYELAESMRTDQPLQKRISAEPARQEEAYIPAPQMVQSHLDREQFPLPQEEMTPEKTFLHYKLEEVIPVYKSLSPTRQAVLIRMADMTSVDSLLSFRLMLNALERGDFEEASQEMLLSRWADTSGGAAYVLAESMRMDQPMW